MIKNKNLDPAADIEASKLKAGGTQGLSGREVKNLAAAAAVPGIPVLFRFELAATGATTTNTDVVTTYKIRVINAWTVKTAAAAANNDANTVQILNSTNAITDALSIRNVADTAITKFTQINDANATIAAGGTLRVAQVLASAIDNNACEVYVLAVRVA